MPIFGLCGPRSKIEDTYINKRKKQISTCFIDDIQNIIIKYILEYRSTNEKNGISGAETNFA